MSWNRKNTSGILSHWKRPWHIRQYMGTSLMMGEDVRHLGMLGKCVLRAAEPKLV